MAVVRQQRAATRRPGGRRRTKRLGQHFLLDQEVASRIVAAAELEDRPPVFEIGAGRGALTDALRKATDQLYVLEVDPDLVNVLIARYRNDPSVVVIEGDVLALELPALSGESSVHVVGNLPYSIASQILLRIVELRGWCPLAVVMVQEEVGRRVVAKPGGRDYGVLTLLVQLYADVTWCFDVSHRSFSPMPRVESAVIQLRPQATARVPVADPALFRYLVRSLFQQRRKMLRNTLGNILGEIDVGEGEAAAVLWEAGIDPSARPEHVSLEEFAALTAAVEARRPGQGGPDVSRRSRSRSPR